ncbi:MAG: transglutaminase domain-containing protein [Gemmataceae bacterium]|nr:transglutaminase domain-containing protein [Gemmataceae bacterium]
MRKLFFTLFCALMVITSLSAQAPVGKVIQDSWDAAYLEGARCGHFHTQVREFTRDGKTFFSSTVEMHLSLRRYKSVVTMRMDSVTVENAEGKIDSFRVIQHLDQGKAESSGEVKDGKLWLKIPGVAEPRPLPWNDKAVGPYQQEQMPRLLNLKAGGTYQVSSFEPNLLQVIQLKVQLFPEEEVDILTSNPKNPLKPVQAKGNLKRMEVESEKVVIFGNPLQLPKMVSWVDDSFTVKRTRTEMPGMGAITLYKTSEEFAKKMDGDLALLPDIGINTMIALDRRVANIHKREEVVYRFQVKGEDGAAAFVNDGRQKIKKQEDGWFELTVAGNTGVKDDDAPKENLEASFFLDSEDAEVKKLAAMAVGASTNPLEKARKIEKFVSDKMTGASDIGFATAAQVAKSLRGDCRQHAMLMAAMCRAAGVPARTAIGLVYVEDRQSRKPLMGFHMWTEVFADGAWIGLDATLGEGVVGPGHVKIAHHNWHNQQTLAPLLPVIRVMGQVKMEVLSAK